MPRTRALRRVAWAAAAVTALLALRLTLGAHRAPFEELRWDRGMPSLEVGSGRSLLVEVAGVPVERLVEEAVEVAGPGYQDLFLDEFAALFARASSHRLPPIVRLVLESPVNRGRRTELALATRGKWRRALRRRDERRRADSGGSLELTPGSEALELPRLDSRASAPRSEWLSGATARRDLEILAGLLASRFAYLEASDHRQNMAGLEDGVSRRDFAFQLSAFLARFDDLHSRVVLSASRIELPFGELPYRLVELDEGIACLRPDGRGFADPAHPLLGALGEVGIEDLLHAVGRLIPRPSEAFHRAESVRRLRRIGLAAALARVELSNNVKLISADGRSAVTRRWRGETPRAVSAPRPVETRVLAGGVGYLALRAGMFDTPQFERWLDKALGGLRRKRALILDLRDNPGGSRATIPRLVGFLAAKELTPIGASAVRMDRGRRPPGGIDLLRRRAAFTLDSNRWAPQERAALDAFAAGIPPSLELSGERFSDLHFALARRQPGAPRFHGPVVVLQNEATASAAAVLAAVLGRLPTVTVMGRRSAGGSGYPLRYRLPGSRLVVQLSAVASFDPKGRRFAGAEPDVALPRTLQELQHALAEGTDPWLDRALSWLVSRAVGSLPRSPRARRSWQGATTKD